MITNSIKKHLTGFSWIICYLSFSVALLSCSDEDYLGGHSTTDGVGALMGVTGQVDPSASLTIAVGGGIGITTTYANHDQTARNRKYVLQSDGQSYLPGNNLPIYVKGNTSVMAYYPFTGDENAEPTLTLSTKNQASPVDMLVAKTEGVTIDNASSVKLNFKSALATLKVSITASGETITDYVLSGFAQEGAIDPYTFAVTPSLMQDVQGSGSALTSLSFHIVPQTVADGKAMLTLKGSVRTYALSLGAVTLGFGETRQLNVNIADGEATYEFVPGGSQWNDSGLGGDVSSN